MVLQYILTGLAGIALGVVAMRLWQSREVEASAQAGAKGTAVPGEEAAQAGAAGSLLQSRNLLIGAGALAVLAAAVLAFRGGDSTPAAGATTAAANAQQLADVDTMISRLEERLAKEPTNGEGFRMLGWSYVMTGRPEKAIAPYKKALELLPDNATVRAGYGEALVGVAGGKVTEEAKGAFDQALKLDPKEPRARYFQGLWLAQNGQQRQALDQWIDLVNSAPADAPWQGEVQRKINEVAGQLKIDVAGRIKPAVAAAAAGTVVGAAGAVPPPPAAQAAAISQMPPAQQQASIDGMVEGLAAKLKTNPKDAAGWTMLIRSRMVLKQADKAGQDLVTARKALAGDAAGLAQVNAAAKDAGVPGA